MKELGLKKKVLKNSIDDLIEAVSSGRITFYRGEFTGKFNATLSKELKRLGAKWDRTHGTWKIPQSELSAELKNAIATSEFKLEQTMQRIDKKLEKFLPEEISDKLKVENIFDTTLWKIDKKFHKSIKNITVAPVLTPERRKKIAEGYSENMKLFVKDFTQKQIKDLREKIQESTFKGIRHENMVKEIQKSYGVSVNKAKFLARQETSILIATFKKARYQDAGVKRYKWGCVKMPHQPKGAKYVKGEVRYHHGVLEGKEFSWDAPPIVNEKGEHKNPGEDYNCRCYAKPIVRFSE